MYTYIYFIPFFLENLDIDKHAFMLAVFSSGGPRNASIFSLSLLHHIK